MPFVKNVRKEVAREEDEEAMFFLLQRTKS